jgi:hypothetical protein
MRLPLPRSHNKNSDIIKPFTEAHISFSGRLAEWNLNRVHFIPEGTMVCPMNPLTKFEDIEAKSSKWTHQILDSLISKTIFQKGEMR